ELGAQNTPKSWVMNITFIFLGIVCIVESLLNLNKFRWHQMILILFGVGLILSGLFKHMPIDHQINYSVREDELHSMASSLVGMSFTVFVFSSIFILNTKANRYVALSIGTLICLLSLGIFKLPHYAGLFQRLIFFVSFIWLIDFFVRENYDKLATKTLG
ncbi:MAG: DUF998 domain-containing protein, partial [Clostridium sp.]|nr:DUF998 domain-containing protein [Clostridium sp.]